MRIAAAQLNIKPGRPDLNLPNMLGMLASASAQGAELVVFPELCLCGPLIGRLMDSAAFRAECVAAAQTVAAAADIPVIYGNIREADGAAHSAVYLARHGETRLLADDAGDSFVLPDSGLMLDISLAPLLLDGEENPAHAGQAMLRVNGCGMYNNGKSNHLLSGGSFWQKPSGLIARAPLFVDGLYIWDDAADNEIASHAAGGELLADSLVAGAKAFMASINSRRAVIGLSGGVDSALAACVYGAALGVENLRLISMPSRFNSDSTKNLAQELALALGAPFAVLPVEDSSNALINQLEQAVFTDKGVKISLNTAARENVLARERARILAAVSAAENAIFTCNGNKAECSVGYATFYGDLAGAFAAQADLWKFQTYEAAAAFARRFPAAAPALSGIAAIRPSAELSAAQDVDKGLGDPLHYPYHDYLLRSWVEGGHDISDSLRLYMDKQLEAAIGCAPGLTGKLFATPANFCADLEYWWKMYRGMGVAKRLQAPPLLALTRHPFGADAEPQHSPWYSGAYQELKGRLGI